jgi:hypothetical protein
MTSLRLLRLRLALRSLRWLTKALRSGACWMQREAAQLDLER